MQYFSSACGVRVNSTVATANSRIVIGIFFAFLLFVALLPAQAYAGFGNDTGKVVIPIEIGSTIAESVRSMARQSDGKLVIGGQCFIGGAGLGLCLARLNVDGSLDATFNGGLTNPAIPGKIAISATNRIRETFASIAIDGNGKIVAAGACTENVFCVARFNSNGSVDTSFNAGGTNGAAAGRVAFTFANSAIDIAGFGGMAIQPVTNKIVIVGRCASKQCIARLNENGDFDSGFAPASSIEGTGRFTFNVAGSLPGRANAVVIEPTGKIIVAGSCAESLLDLAKSVCLAKFNDDGSFDTSFTGGAGGAGAFRIRVFTSGASVTLINENSVALALDGGKLNLLCKHQFNGPDACLYRFNASNGTIDTSFAPSEPVPGKRVFQIPGISNTFNPTAIAVDPSSPGRLVVVGLCIAGAANGSDKYCVARFTNAGAPDSTFTGPNGDATAGFAFIPGIGGLDSPYAVNVDAAGNVFVGGDCGNNMCVFGFDANGALNSSPCAANVDADPAILATTDGMLIIRSMLNLPGSLTAPRGLGYDVDGDGVINASRDGLIFLRAMLGFKEASINSGISVAAFANRKTWPDIRSYLNTRCGMNLSP